jgi:hypothetical protein
MPEENSGILVCRSPCSPVTLLVSSRGLPGRTGWTAKWVITMDGLTVILLVLVGGVAFTFGFFVGSQVFEAMLRGREKRLAAERRMINEAWRRLSIRFGIEKAAWITAFLDQQTIRDTTSASRQQNDPDHYDT